MNDKQEKLAEEIKEIILEYYADFDDIQMISLDLECTRGGVPIKIIVQPNSVGGFIVRGGRHLQLLKGKLPNKYFRNRTTRRTTPIRIEGYHLWIGQKETPECPNCGIEWKSHETCVEWID